MSRKIDLAAFRGDDDDDEEDGLAQFLPKKQLELNALKNRTFNHGITKKSKKDLEREAAERKAKEEAEALAKVNAELEAFESQPATYGYNPHAGGPGAMGRMRGMGGGFVRAGGEGYAPPPLAETGFKPVPTGPAKMPPAGPSAMGYARKQRSPSPVGPPKPKGKRAMDSFLEEIKSNQNQRETRLGGLAKQEGSSITALAAWEHNPAARKQVDQVAESTNVMIANLPGNVTEKSLGEFFAKCGPIGTVKIMWPRSQAELQAARTGRASLLGFVNFMKRESAAKAINELDRVTWGGILLRLAWGQPMPLPAKAIYGIEDESKHTSGSRDRHHRSPSPTARRHEHRHDSPPPSVTSPGHAHAGPAGAKRQSLSRTRSRSKSRSRSRTRSRSPPRKPNYRDDWLGKVSEEQNNFVTAVAKRVKEHGKPFEQLLREKEKDNAKFAFLRDDELPEYHLYRYTVDSSYRFPAPPFLPFNDAGYASCYSSDSAEDSEKEHTPKGKIGRLARRRFESILRALSGKRVEIARAMEFAVRHAEAADEVADIICKSLKVEQTEVPRKLARLHLVSDILHNSASPLPNVWRYRMAFESRLPAVFAHLAKVHQSLSAYSGKIAAEVFRGQVGAVIEIWEGWIVFTQEVSDQLRALLDGHLTMDQIKEAKRADAVKAEAKEGAAKQKQDRRDRDAEIAGKGFKTGGFKSSFKRIGNLEQQAEDLLNEALAMGDAEEAAAEPPAEEDVDGEPMEEDLDGEPMDIDGEEMDIDGEAMDIDGEDMDIDGEEMEDLDGEAM